MPTQWNETQLDLLKSGWADSKNSLSEIAAHINAQTGSEFSRSSIAGKANRLGLPLRRKPNQRRGQRAERRPSTRSVNLALIRKPRCQPLVEIVPIGEPEHLGLGILKLDNQVCHYPRGDANYTFCGQPSVEGRPYCVFHLQLCYRPPESRAVRRAA